MCFHADYDMFFLLLLYLVHFPSLPSLQFGPVALFVNYTEKMLGNIPCKLLWKKMSPIVHCSYEHKIFMHISYITAVL